MIRHHILLAAASVFTLTACDQILEPVKLNGLAVDPAAQEDFEVTVEPLTFDVAGQLNAARFDRYITQPGRFGGADVVSEGLFKDSQFPPGGGPLEYQLGVGDEVAFLLYEGESSAGLGSMAQLATSSDTISGPAIGGKVITTAGRVGSDGSLLLLGVGRLTAHGRTISDLRDEVRSILIRNGKLPNFQLDISGFQSKKAYVTTDGAGGVSSAITSFPITDRRLTLRQLAATSGVPLNEAVLTVVSIQRGGETYSFTLADLYAQGAPEVFLRDDDHIFIQSLAYKSAKVFLVGAVSPTIVPIQPEVRQTLADVLFAQGGPLASDAAQRSAVYLLRGREPVTAYHLDAQNPLRLLVADAVELRPNDIVYVGEKPLASLAKTFSTVRGLQVVANNISDDLKR